MTYTILRRDGIRISDGRVALRAGPGPSTWIAAIPAQAAGAAIAYHAVLQDEAGVEIRHPSRAPSEYRFRVVGTRVLSVKLPSSKEVSRGRASVEIRLEASSLPSGDLVARLPAGDTGAAADRRVPLVLTRREATSGGAAVFAMRADLPALAPSRVADFYVELRDPAGGPSRWPADAPARAYSVKRSVAPLRRLSTDNAFVLGLAGLGERRFVGLSGGGLWAGVPDESFLRLGAEVGITSSVARLVLSDPATGQIVVGTDGGLVEIGAGGRSWLPLGPPRTSAWSETTAAVGRAAWRWRAGPGALSSLDGTLVVQIQGEDPGGRMEAEAELLTLRDGRLERRVLPTPDVPLAGLSAAAFDPVDGCFLLGGFLRMDAQGLRPAVMRSCGDAPRVIALRDPVPFDRPATIERVVALARDPVSASPVVALRILAGDGEDRRAEHGVFRLDMETGRLAPIAPGTLALGVEVSALATDWTGRRLLVGTIGRGLLWTAAEGLRPLAPAGVDPPPGAAPAASREITALRVEDASGAILVGTSQGAFEISSGGNRRVPIGPAGHGPLLADALPADVDQGSGRVLLSSHRDGLVELERGARGLWSIAPHPQPGLDVHEGAVGDARYDPRGGLIAIMESRGLLLLREGRTTLLGPAEGLQGPYVQRILALRNGDLWAVHLPLPFGAEAHSSLQMIRDGKVARTIEIAGREAATVARWLEVPERGSVFAATRAGALEIRGDGTWERRSQHAASSIARDPASGTIGIVGAGVERWDGERFRPVLFSLRHPRWSGGPSGAGTPIDLAIDRCGTWHVLYPGGLVALLRPDEGLRGILDPEDGVPPTAVRLLAHPTKGEVFVGSDGEGVAIIGPCTRTR